MEYFLINLQLNKGPPRRGPAQRGHPAPPSGPGMDPWDPRNVPRNDDPRIHSHAPPPTRPAPAYVEIPEPSHSREHPNDRDRRRSVSPPTNYVVTDDPPK